MLMDRLSISERRACRAIDQPRSTQRRAAPVPGAEEEHLRTRLRELARAHPRYGYRRLTTILCREGYCVNHKRIQRLCRDEGLRILKRAKKRSRVGSSATDGTKLRATHPNHVWALDYQFDQTTNFRTLKLLNITDEFTNEALAINVSRSITSDDTVKVLEGIVAQRGTTPEFLRMDNGTQLTANALRDWCRFSSAGSVYIQPGAALGRTRSSNRSTASSATSCSTLRRSRHCLRLKYWQKTSESSTTSISLLLGVEKCCMTLHRALFEGLLRHVSAPVVHVADMHVSLDLGGRSAGIPGDTAFRPALLDGAR
jgi:transposase InsO family protein